MAARLTLVVTLTVRADRLDEFRAFEQQAAVIMATCGGSIERTVVVRDGAPRDTIREVHIVTFPSEAAFSAYQSDERLMAIAHLRAASVLNTEVLIGEDRLAY